VPAYATTILKSQFQSLNNVGLCLDKDDIITHGMLYVALSRSRKGLTGIFFKTDTYKIYGNKKFNIKVNLFFISYLFYRFTNGLVPLITTHR
jgi:ATP-dependent exoDNAse (exonuclease V) alpha subunit